MGKTTETRTKSRWKIVIYKIPEPLTETQYEWEVRERKNMKNNIFLGGIRTVGRGIIHEIKNIVRGKLNIEIHIKKLRAIGGALIVELQSLENKVNDKVRSGTRVWS